MFALIDTAPVVHVPELQIEGVDAASATVPVRVVYLSATGAKVAPLLLVNVTALFIVAFVRVPTGDSAISIVHVPGVDASTAGSIELPQPLLAIEKPALVAAAVNETPRPSTGNVPVFLRTSCWTVVVCTGVGDPNTSGFGVADTVGAEPTSIVSATGEFSTAALLVVMLTVPFFTPTSLANDVVNVTPIVHDPPAATMPLTAQLPPLRA